MPELPEVETICSCLKKVLINRKLISVQVDRNDLRIPISEDFSYLLSNLVILNVYRRAKYIVIKMNNGTFLVIHLGMTGKLLYNHESNKHDHVTFHLEDGDRLVFNDIRRFGFTFTTRNVEKFFSHLGPEPLDVNYSGFDLFNSLKKHTTEIKNALINGKIIAGIGNIYASEALFEARISPFRKANSLSDIECEILVSAIKRVLKKAIVAGGTTLKDYRNPHSDAGYFQHKLQVYKQEKCNVCNNNIKRALQSGRRTFFCQICQASSQVSI